MKKWQSIEGLRAWLAWIVVLGHCVQAVELTEARFVSRLFTAGMPCVIVFIVISGFVITHLLVEKQEAYFPFITRRFFRLYPLFVVTCILGAITLPLFAFGVSRMPWPVDASKIFLDTLNSQNDRLWAHIAAHAFMLHGAVPEQILRLSSLTFLAPAWSISLEWQFYLIAPLMLFIARRRVGALLLLGLCWLGGHLFFQERFGSFAILSFLPGALGMFAVGIGSRLVWPYLEGRITSPTLVAGFALAITPVSSSYLTPLLFWVAFFAFICADPRAKGIDALALQVRDRLVQNRVALYWGDRSYSVYLCHFPVLSVAIYFLADYATSKWSALAILTAGTLLGTAAVSMLTYRLIEMPGMKLGRFVADAIPASFTPRAERRGLRA